MLPCTCKMVETPNCPESRESESSIEQASAASRSSTDSSNSKSLLDVLKAHTLAEIARKRAVRVCQSSAIWEASKPRWKNNSSNLPQWSAVARKILLMQPSSAAAERVFSLLKATFTEQLFRTT